MAQGLAGDSALSLAEDAEGASGSEPTAGSTGSSTGPCATSLSVPSWSGRSCLRATGACGSARREPASCNGRTESTNGSPRRTACPGTRSALWPKTASGNLWVGTNQGLGRLTGGRWSHLGIAQGLSSNLVRAVFEDASGNLWIGFYGGGLSRLRDGEFTSLSAQDGLVHDLAWGITETPDDSLWVSTNGGVSRRRGGRARDHDRGRRSRDPRAD